MNIFKINIGDWSEDGHGKCKDFIIETNLTIEEIREAYFAAEKVVGKKYPEEVCCDYEDYSVDLDMINELKELGFEFTDCDHDEDALYPTQEAMVKLTLWYISKGNSDFRYAIKKKPEMPSLNFYGFDEKKRHIGFIGYGLFD